MDIFEISEQYFCCPICKGKLKIERIGKTADGILECVECNHKYLVMDNIPIMLPYSYVEARIKDGFLGRHPNYRALFEDIATVIDDNIKQHQIKTWGTQYFEVINAFSVSRTVPQTRDVYSHNLFYTNSRKLLYDIILNKRKRDDNEVFLDVGCGEGAFAYFGMENFKLYFGMDISFSAISKCYSKFSFKNCVFLVGDAENIPLRNASVNVCAAQWLFEHLSNPQKCASEISKILSNHGNVYIDTNHRNFTLHFKKNANILH